MSARTALPLLRASLLLVLGGALRAQDPEAARSWWEGMAPQQRAQMWERYERFRQLPPDAQQEVRRRIELLSLERGTALARMDPAEHARWEALPQPQRVAELDELVRKSLLDRTMELERQFPAAFRRLRELPLAERFDAGARMLEKLRGEDVEAGLQRAVDEGWLGAHARDYLQHAPLQERLYELGEVAKLRFLERAHRERLWDGYGLTGGERTRLLGLHPLFFLRAVDLLGQGVPKERVLEMPELWQRESDGRWQDPPPDAPH